MMSRQPSIREGLRKGPAAGRWRILLSLTLAAFSLLGTARGQELATAPAANSKLDRKVKAVLETPGFRDGHWGLLVIDGKTGATVFEQHADRLFAPASVTKLFSVASALIELGPDYRFETPVVRRGDVDPAGTLRGDLILIARGDLSMGGRTGPDGKLLFKDDDHTYAGGNFRSDIVPADPLAGLDHLAREVHAAGIKQVTGDVVIDDRLFESAESTGSGPRRLSPIVINDNVVDVLVSPASSEGEPAQVSFQPPTRYMTMDAQVDTVAASGETKLEIQPAGPRGFKVRGKIPMGHSRIVGIREVDQPAAFARALFIEALRRRGVQVEASPLADNPTSSLPPAADTAKLPKVAEYTSPPFREYVRVILKVSHNLYASTLPLLVAARHGERTLEAGLKRQGQVLKGLGLDLGSLSFGGGAGGSRADLVTPRATVALLRAMAARTESSAFDNALPILGRDGTLARAVAPDSPARGHAHAKTGTYWVDNELSGKALLTSKALAGYLETASGRPLVIAFFVNNVMLDAPKPGRTVSDATADAGRLLGRLCEVFYANDADHSGVPADRPDRPPAADEGSSGTAKR